MSTRELPVLPVLPEPKIPNPVMDCTGAWIHTDEMIQAYGQKCAAHAREMALEEAMQECLDASECYQDNGAAHLAYDYISRLKKSGK